MAKAKSMPLVWVRRARLAHGWTLPQLGARVGLHYKTLGKLERGSSPGGMARSTVMALHVALGLPPLLYLGPL